MVGSDFIILFLNFYLIFLEHLPYVINIIYG